MSTALPKMYKTFTKKENNCLNIQYDVFKKDLDSEIGQKWLKVFFNLLTNAKIQLPFNFMLSLNKDTINISITLTDEQCALFQGTDFMNFETFMQAMLHCVKHPKKDPIGIPINISQEKNIDNIFEY